MVKSKPFDRAGEPWTSDEETHLKNLFGQELLISEISDVLQRSPSAIATRINNLELFDFGFYQKFFEKRGIKRFCHFTRLEAVEEIIKCDSVHSKTSLESQSIKFSSNDPDRLDSHPDYISCTIQYPNLYVLDDFRVNHPRAKWVIIEITPTPALMLHAKVCVTNAATKKGSLIKEGAEAFEELYGERAWREKRTDQHLVSTPTNLQAEVLVKRRINLNRDFRFIVPDSETSVALSSIRDLIDPELDLQIAIEPRFFQRGTIKTRVRTGTEIDPHWVLSKGHA